MLGALQRRIEDEPEFPVTLIGTTRLRDEIRMFETKKVAVIPDELGGGTMENKPGISYVNNFFGENLEAIGGGGVKLRHLLNGYARKGGSLQDKLNYLKTYKGEKPDPKITLPLDDAVRTLFAERISISKQDLDISGVNINYDATPGSLLKNMHLSKKFEAAPILVPEFQKIVNSWSEGPTDTGVEVWSMASRPKLRKLEEHLTKMRKGDSVGRVISIPSMKEQCVAYPAWKKLADRVQERAHLLHSPIKIGLNRHGQHWRSHGQVLEGMGTVWCSDWSKFDQSISAPLMRYAFDVMFHALVPQDPETTNYLANLRDYMEKNVIKKVFYLGELEYVLIDRGVPSGSVWTSLLDSVINYVVNYEIIKGLKYVRDYVIYVYGDDTVVGMTGDEEKIKRRFKRSYIRAGELRFGMKVSAEDSYLTDVVRVGYSRPIFDLKHDLTLGTRNLTPSRFEKSDTSFKEYDHARGESHRWNYDFKKRPSFISFYWDEDFNPIRSSFETFKRVMHTETPVKTPEEHITLLLSHLYDNCYNQHVVNWMYHILYDCEFLQSMWKEGSGGQMQVGASLLNKDDPYHKRYHTEKVVKGMRMWYRRVEGVFDLPKEKVMQMYNLRWSGYVDIILKSVKRELKFGMVHNRRKEMERVVAGSHGFSGIRFDEYDAFVALGRYFKTSDDSVRTSQAAVSNMVQFCRSVESLVGSQELLGEHDRESKAMQHLLKRQLFYHRLAITDITTVFAWPMDQSEHDRRLELYYGERIVSHIQMFGQRDEFALLRFGRPPQAPIPSFLISQRTKARLLEERAQAIDLELDLQ